MKNLFNAACVVCNPYWTECTNKTCNQWGNRYQKLAAFEACHKFVDGGWVYDDSQISAKLNQEAEKTTKRGRARLKK